MDIGLAAWGLREETLESQLEITSSLGVDLLELSIAGYERDRLQAWSTDDDIEKVKALFAKYNIRLECACPGNDFTLDDVPTQVGKVKCCEVIARPHPDIMKFVKTDKGV